MEKIRANDVVTLYVAYADKKGGKSRPVVVQNISENKIKVFRITTKYKEKSNTIKEQYFRLDDWKEAGLDKLSWVDLGQKATILRKDVSIKQIGKLSTNDKKKMTKKINSLTRNRTKKVLKQMLIKRLERVVDNFCEEKQIPLHLINKEIISDKIADSQVEYGIDDLIRLISQEGNINYSVIRDSIKDYINENYSDDYLFLKVDEQVNEENIREELINKILITLGNTEPYKAVRSSYWSSKLYHELSIDELDKYAHIEDESILNEFVVKYFPNWKEMNE